MDTPVAAVNYGCKVSRNAGAIHEDLKALLVSTGTARLVETATVDSPVNRLWGEVNGIGQNKLGELLMEVRTELQAAEDCRIPPQRGTKRSAAARA